MHAYIHTYIHTYIHFFFFFLFFKPKTNSKTESTTKPALHSTNPYQQQKSARLPEQLLHDVHEVGHLTLEIQRGQQQEPWPRSLGACCGTLALKTARPSVASSSSLPVEEHLPRQRFAPCPRSRSPAST